MLTTYLLSYVQVGKLREWRVALFGNNFSSATCERAVCNNTLLLLSPLPQWFNHNFVHHICHY